VASACHIGIGNRWYYKRHIRISLKLAGIDVGKKVKHRVSEQYDLRTSGYFNGILNRMNDRTEYHLSYYLSNPG
jgi:hypothetical protein